MAAPPRPVSPARTRAHCRACLWPPSPPGRSRASSLRRAHPPLAATGRRFPCPAPVPPAPPRMRRTGRVPRPLAFAAPTPAAPGHWHPPLLAPAPCCGRRRPVGFAPAGHARSAPSGYARRPTRYGPGPLPNGARAPPQNVYKKRKMK
nr:serine/arginine repetitive matrix protein 1-like [Aegilops tauschii subsp. strangulata]